MNIASLPADKKKDVWLRLKYKQPDIAKFITDVVAAFPGKYRYISVSRIDKK